jgi:hypothetical protein
VDGETFGPYGAPSTAPTAHVDGGDASVAELEVLDTSSLVPSVRMAWSTDEGAVAVEADLARRELP